MSRDPGLFAAGFRLPFAVLLLLALCAGAGPASADGRYAPRQPQDVFIDQPPMPVDQQASPGRPDCPDPGSWGVVDGPSPPPGRPLVAQGWDACADMPGRGPRPNINVEVMIDPSQNGNGQGGQDTGDEAGGWMNDPRRSVPRGGFLRGGGAPGGFVR